MVARAELCCAGAFQQGQLLLVLPGALHVRQLGWQLLLLLLKVGHDLESADASLWKQHSHRKQHSLKI